MEGGERKRRLRRSVSVEGGRGNAPKLPNAGQSMSWRKKNLQRTRRKKVTPQTRKKEKRSTRADFAAVLLLRREIIKPRRSLRRCKGKGGKKRSWRRSPAPKGIARTYCADATLKPARIGRKTKKEMVVAESGADLRMKTPSMLSPSEGEGTKCGLPPTLSVAGFRLKRE